MLLTLLFLAFAGRGSAQLVNTKYGPVQGHPVPLQDGTQVMSYLGVPFAKPPLGQMRFSPPQEPDPWTEVFVASRLGNACPQSSGTVGVTHPLWDRFNEDCLNLNIQTPHESTTPGPYPVMIWFHGGAYRFSANIQYPGHFYAAQDVIMVAANYRLGALGFISSEDEAARGNYGMLDQVQAMRFVQENIAAFGGDPNRVTIFGQSAGGASVGLHLVSPMSAGLFQQAIMHSGTDTSIWAANPAGDIPSNLTRQVAIQLECPTAPSQAMIDCLRTKDAEEIRSARIETYLGKFTLGFVPCVDGPGHFLPEMPFSLRQKGQFNQVPLVSGVTSNEVGPAFMAVENGLNQTLFRLAVEGTANFFGFNDPQDKIDQMSAAMTFTYTTWPHKDSLIQNRNGLMNMANDLAFGTSTDTSLKFQTENNPTYMYNFGYRSDILDELLPKWTGVFHAADIPYIFGHPHIMNNPGVANDVEMDIIALIPWTQADLDYSEFWVTMMANFAKYGDPTPTPVKAPGRNEAVTWNPFTYEGLSYLNVTKEEVSESASWHQKQHAMWQEYMPYIMEGDDGESGTPSTGSFMWPTVPDEYGNADPDVIGDILDNVMAGLDL